MVEELKKLVDSVHDEYDAYVFIMEHGQALVEALADADRYRWLRDEATSDGQWEVLQESNGMMRVHLFADELDAAIDLARTKAGAGGGA